MRGAHLFIGIGTIGVAFVAALYAFQAEPVYEARAAVEARPGAVAMLTSEALVLKAARAAGLQADQEFNAQPGNASMVTNVTRNLTARAAGQMIHMEFRACNAEHAAGFANALVDAYIDELESRSMAKSVERSADLDAMQAALDSQEAKLAASKLTALQSKSLIIELNRQRNSYDVALMRATAMAPRTAALLVDRARVPAEPIRANPGISFAYGVLLLLLGGLIFLISRRRLRQLPAPVVHGQVMCGQREIEKPVVAVSNAGTGFIHPDTLMDYVENLLGSGKTVLIIDCEVGGALTDSVGLRGEFGFTDFLLQSPLLDGGVPAWKTNRDRVSVMPVGTRPNRISVLLASDALPTRLAELVARFDRVVINAPPVLTAGDMRAISPLVDGVILVAAQDRSLNLAHWAVREVEDFGGRVIGLVEDASPVAVL